MQALRGTAGALFLGLCVGAAVTWETLHKPAPDGSATVWVDQIREAARLETLDVDVHKKIDFAPDPSRPDGSWRDVVAWAMDTLNPKQGKVIVFATAHLGVNLPGVSDRSLRVRGTEAWVNLPPIDVGIELLPEETEVVDSNLNSQQTMALLQRAKVAFAADVLGNTRLTQKARTAAERAVRELLQNAGFATVHFVDAPGGEPGRL